MGSTSETGMHVRLYVAGDSPNSVLARRNLTSALAGSPDHKLEIIDVLEDPKRGLADGVLVTPTLVKVSPAPAQQVVGNLRDADALRAVLGLERHGS